MKSKLRFSEKGITLVSLIIAIIIAIILAGVTISTLIGENSLIRKSTEVSFVNEMVEYKELLELEKTEIQIEEGAYGVGKKSLSYNILEGEKLKQTTSNIPEEMLDKLAIIGEDIIYITTEMTEEIKIIEELGYIIVHPEDINYMKELQMVENAIRVIKENEYKYIGKELETLDYPETVTLASTYGKGWWIIGDGDINGTLGSNIINQLEQIDGMVLTEEEKQYFTHSPYIVTYDEQYVQSVGGKNINSNTELERWSYTYNYNGELDGILTSGLIVAITENSEKNNTSWGNFESNVNESEFTYEEDKYGNKGLVAGGITATMEIGENTRIHEQYTASILIKGSTAQSSSERVFLGFFEDNSMYFGNTLLSISDNSGKYTCWMSLAENNLRIHAYSGIQGGMPELGYLTIDVSQYNDKYMYIQLSVIKGGEARLYINGEYKATFDAGEDEMVDRIISIGDLRPERNLKYTGLIYAVDLYATALEENGIKENWEYVKEIYHIDGFGNQE